MIKGINLGSGDYWSYPGWVAIDELSGEILNELSVFPQEDNSVENIYSCHFFEHVDNKTSLNLFKESYRVLKKGGVLRIVVPDTQKFINKYLENDLEWYLATGFSGRPEWPHHGVDNEITNLMLHFLACYDYNGSRGFYRGPPMLIKEEVKEKAATRNIGDFCDWVFNQIPTGPNIKTQHINWWTYSKFKEFLEEVGFVNVVHSSYMQTASGEMRSGNKFDNEKPNRKHFSLYVEVIK